jgi:4-hydroxymandelate oxidase
VLIGRPILWALAADGEKGVGGVIGELTDQLRRALAYCGACRPQDVSEDLLGPRPIGGSGL